jgi:hypothetical protein
VKPALILGLPGDFKRAGIKYLAKPKTRDFSMDNGGVKLLQAQDVF